MPLWTIGRVIDWAAGHLKAKGLDQARLDSELLLAKALGEDRLYLYLNWPKPLEPAELEAFKALLKRRLAREPVAYIVGRKAFYNLELEVGPAALIPRPETETLVEAALALLPQDSTAEVADLGTGCGNIAFALAQERPGIRAIATDVSTEALGQARRNAQNLGLDGRVEFLSGDLFAPLSGRRLDMILMNPPYVSEAEYATLAPEIVAFEPALALLAGPDGLAVINRLVAQAPEHLKPGGFLLFEIGSGQGDEVRRLLGQGPWIETDVLPDLAGRERVAKARLLV